MELISAAVLFILLIGASWTCLWMQRILPERHRSAETAGVLRLVISMMVTLAAVVLGLLITESKANFDQVTNDVRGFSTEIIELNRLMRRYGPETDHARLLLREYTAAAIATTWTNEPAPPGALHPPQPSDTMENPTLGRMLGELSEALWALHPSTDTQRGAGALARSRFETLMQLRWKLIEEAPGEVSAALYIILGLWLVLVFASFGLIAPRNALVGIILVLCAVAIASAMFIMLEMDTPFGGLIAVPSTPMRDALAHLDGAVPQPVVTDPGTSVPD